MEIKLSIKNKSGEAENITYHDIESETDFEGKKIKGCRAYCFNQGKFVIVYADSKGYWTPPGGGVEEGESVRDAVRREVKEETNMNVVKQRFIGLIEVASPQGINFYTTSVCLVEPLGDFVADPDGEITQVKMIDLKEYKSYSNVQLDAIVERQMQRASEAADRMQAEI